MKRFWFMVLVLMVSISELLAQATFQKKTYYDSEQTKIKETITLLSKDSTLHGEYQSIYENGSLAIKGNYDHGISDGKWVYYFENGREKITGSYDQGRQDGKWTYQYESGERRALGNYKNDVLHGYWTYYFENGSEKSSGLYFEDKKEGIWNYFYEDGTLKAQAYFQQGKGTYKEFYPSGKLKNTGRNENDKSTGLWIYYYESGEQEASGTYENGLREGTWTYFHENGQIAAQGLFNAGEKSGTWKYYFPDGRLSSEGIMTKDQKDGFWKLYYQTGELKGEGKYEQGAGEYIEYYASGKQKARGKVIDGQRSGKWQYFNESGAEDGEANFTHGVGEYVGYYPDGSIKMTGTIEDDKRTGKWTLYNPDGTVAGIYRPVYEEQQPIFRTSTLTPEKEEKKQPDKPQYRYRNNKVRYFEPTINEYTGLILSTNPVVTLIHQLPISLEHYIQERLGHELQLTLLKNPFYSKEDGVNSLTTLGLNVDMKQKFYHEDTELGMFYFGHQLRAGYSQFQSRVIDSLTVNPPSNRRINAEEFRFGYGVFIGDRWMQRAGDSGLTFDFNIGIMIGQRNFNGPSEPSYQFIFDELNQDKFYLPVLFTLHIGYAGPKRRTTSF